MMKPHQYWIGIAIALLICGVAWWFLNPGFDQFEDFGAVEDFELLLDGEAFPDELEREHAYAVRLRFRLSSRLQDISKYEVAGMIVAPHKLVADGKELDGHSFYFQPPQGEKSTAHIEAMREGKIVSVTPERPSKDDDIVQFCGLIHPSSFQYYSNSTEPLEYILWILDKTPGVEPHEDSGDTQRYVYRKKFRIVD